MTENAVPPESAEVDALVVELIRILSVGSPATVIRSMRGVKISGAAAPVSRTSFPQAASSST